MPENKLIRILKVTDPIAPKLLSETFTRWLKSTDYKFVNDLAFKENKQALALGTMRIDYELVDCEGYLNLYDAYIDWWKVNMGFIVHNVYMAVNPSLLDQVIIDKLLNKNVVDEIEPEGTYFQKNFGLMYVNYSMVRGKGRPNLWQAYRDWWDKNEKLTSGWNGEILKVPSSWKSQSFYPINPIKEKENTMQFTISKNQIKRQINALEDLRQDQIKEIQKDLEMKLEKLEKGETIGAVVIGIRNLSEISEQLEYLYSLELADSISCTESEKAQIFKTFEIAKAVEPAE